MAIFDLRGDFRLPHSNGATVFLHIDQAFPGSDLSNAEPLKGTAQEGNVVSTDVTGATRDNDFFLVITWNNGSVGEYHGTFNFLGRLSGVCFDRSHPASQATWFIDAEFRRF